MPYPANLPQVVRSTYHNPVALVAEMNSLVHNAIQITPAKYDAAGNMIAPPDWSFKASAFDPMPREMAAKVVKASAYEVVDLNAYQKLSEEWGHVSDDEITAATSSDDPATIYLSLVSIGAYPGMGERIAYVAGWGLGEYASIINQGYVANGGAPTNVPFVNVGLPVAETSTPYSPDDSHLMQTEETVPTQTTETDARFTDADLNYWILQNIGNPQLVVNAADEYGVSQARIARVTGYTSAQVAAYFVLGRMGVTQFDATTGDYVSPTGNIVYASDPPPAPAPAPAPGPSPAPSPAGSPSPSPAPAPAADGSGKGLLAIALGLLSFINWK